MYLYKHKCIHLYIFAPPITLYEVSEEKMELKEYLFRNDMTLVELGKKTKCTRAHLANVRDKRTRPSISLAMVIEMLTNGEVSVAELRDGFEEGKYKKKDND